MTPTSPPSIALWPIADLIPYARNARTHSPEQIADLARAIDAFGLAGAVVVRGTTIAKGHGTVAACRQIIDRGGQVYPVPGRAGGAAPYPPGQLPVQDATGWDDATFRAFVIADNKLAERSGWDRELLAVELGAIAEIDLDMAAITGFDLGDLERELAAALGQAGGPAPASTIPPAEAAATDPNHARDPAAPNSDRKDRPLVYQVIIGMDQPTKRLWLRIKKQYPTGDDCIRAALEHLSAALEDVE